MRISLNRDTGTIAPCPDCGAAGIHRCPREPAPCERCVALTRELLLLTKRPEGEPSPMAAMPILDAYADERISGGKARELLRCWMRGGSTDDIVTLLPPVEREG